MRRQIKTALLIALLLLLWLSPAQADVSVAIVENSRDHLHQNLMLQELESLGVQGRVYTFPSLPQNVTNPGIWLEDDLESFLRSLDDISALLPRRVAKVLEQILNERRHHHADIEVVNISQGITRVKLYTLYYNLLEQKNAHGAYYYERLRREVYGQDSTKLSATEKRKRLIRYLERWIKRPGSPYQKAMRHYRHLVNLLWEQGCPVVVAAGNDYNLLTPSDPPEAALNLLAEAKVIIAGRQAQDSYDERGSSFAAIKVSARLARKMIGKN